jgi:uncharacterized membrane protein YoaK (UPF0700 family)
MSVPVYILVLLSVALVIIVRKKSRQEMTNFWKKAKIWERIVWVLCGIVMLITAPIIIDAIFKTDSLLVQNAFIGFFMCMMITQIDLTPEFWRVLLTHKRA